MGALDLRRAMGPGAATTFDYAALGSPELEKKLKDTAAKIRDLHDTAMIDIGRDLLTAKDSLEHGKFLDWVEAEFTFGRRTAVRMMQVATEFGNKWDSVSHLPTTVLYKLAAPSTPPAVRDAVLDLKPGEVVTPRGVQAAIEAAKKADAPKKPSLKQAEREAQQAKEDAQRRARVEKADRERDKAVRLQAEIAVQVEALLGSLTPQLSNILKMVDAFTFGRIVEKMVDRRAASAGAGVRS